MDVERELERLEAWICDLMPAALVDDVRAASTVLDLIDETMILLDLAAAYETPHI
jgi:hypothetical protein